MTDMVPMYGFGGGGGTGCTLTITAPVGATVTVSKDGKFKPSKVVDTTGSVVFKGLGTGTWTITITNGTDTATKTVEIKADYRAEITFFGSIINIVYPAGATCTVTDGLTTLNAPDTSGTWEFAVPNAGTWTVMIQKGDAHGQETVQVTEPNQTVSVTLNYRMYFIRGGVLQPDVSIETKHTSGSSPKVNALDGYVQLSTGGNGNAIFYVGNDKIRAYNSMHLKTSEKGGQRSYYNSKTKEIPTMRIVSGTPVLPNSSGTLMQNVVATRLLGSRNPADFAGLDVNLPYSADDNSLNALVYIGGSSDISGTSGTMNITDWWVEYENLS